jgi:HSP20 family protein
MSLIRFETLGNLDAVFGRARSQWRPAADVSETEKEYLIRAELPAVRKEDVKVIVDDSVITIHGERRQDQDDKSEKYHRLESFRGSFTRSFSLPEDVLAEAINCEAKDGVLTVRIPKAQPAVRQPRHIPVA